MPFGQIDGCICRLCSAQAKKRQYDQEVENLEKKQKQTIERLEQDHTSRLRDEAKRIKADQDKELSKFQNMLKNRKKEVWSWLLLLLWCALDWSSLGIGEHLHVV